MLNKHENSGLLVDGILGANTLASLEGVSEIPNLWDPDRKLIGYIQVACRKEGANPGATDGHWGPQTQYAYEVVAGEAPQIWREEEGIGSSKPEGSSWPMQTEQELVRFYGPVGTNQTTIVSPYPLRLSWNTDKVITRFSCHEKVAESIEKALTNVLDHYGADGVREHRLDLWGGCLNVRKMRGGTNWSTHSWGIAIDWDTANNRLRWDHTKATLSRPEYDKWWEFWEAEGWVSLGRARNYDWMHVQAARIAER